MNRSRNTLRELRGILLLWATQSLSALGSAMTGFALVIYSYQAEGSALRTALLSICSYAPYVVMSIFAGALSDRLNKKRIMLVCDTLAALSTLCVLVLFRSGRLEIWHLYVINAVNGLMNTFQQPASDVAITILTPKAFYAKISALRSFSNALNGILSPILAAALLGLGGMNAVIAVDLGTFVIAFGVLLLGIHIPDVEPDAQVREGTLHAAHAAVRYLRSQRGILHLMLFLAAINLTASMYNAALPALLINAGGEQAYGILNMTCALAMLAGSVLATFAPTPRSRVRVVCNTLLLSMGTENFFLAFGRSLPVWCVGAVLGWIAIPLMNANMDVLVRSNVPLQMQGRVYAARNTFQFFTIPLGYLLGGVLTDRVFEPLMAVQAADSLLCTLFGTGKQAGAATLFFLLGLLGVITCIVFRCNKHIWALETQCKNE